jgi:hypothetical protein
MINFETTLDNIVDSIKTTLNSESLNTIYALHDDFLDKELEFNDKVCYNIWEKWS